MAIRSNQLDDFIADVGDFSGRDYVKFLDDRVHSAETDGFEPTWLPDYLFDFQRYATDYAIRKGRSGLFFGCGLGKTPMQLVWLQNVVQHTNKPVLYLTSLGDAFQTVDEASKFGVDVFRSRDGKFPSTAKVIVTNYQKLHLFDSNDFVGVSCNESSCIKDFDGKRSGEVIQFMRKLPYRLLCTATPSPNDFRELGTSSEALGQLGYMDMLARFFQSDNKTLHPFRTHRGGKSKDGGVWSLKPHSEPHFWKWVCSWALACRKPSDLGFADDRFTLPPHEISTHVISARIVKPGYLFDFAASGLKDQRDEARRSLQDRCEMVSSLLQDSPSAVAWCHLNDEGNLLEKIIPDAVQVGSRSQSDEEKEEIFEAFANRQLRVLVTKPIIAGFGLNWQHCSRQTYFPSHSYEQFIQAISRLYRFGQESTVRTHLVTTEGGSAIIDNLNRKALLASEQYDKLTASMRDAQHMRRSSSGANPVEIPSWL